MNWITEVKQWLQTAGIECSEEPLREACPAFDTLFFTAHHFGLVLIDLDRWQASGLPSTYWIDLLNTLQQPCVLLWQDQWLTAQALVKARLQIKLGLFHRIHARHTYTAKIDQTTAEAFLQQHHLQGSTTAKIKYGLFLKKQYVQKYIHQPVLPLNDTLVAVATFSAGRTMKWGERRNTRSYELLRFGSLQGYVVVGGFDKLLQAFINEYQPDDIMSYADRDWSDGKSYTKLGFEAIAQPAVPHAYWVHPASFERHFANRIAKQYDPEWLQQQGWHNIWNAGSLKFIKKISYQS